jgi:hypothetical protein
VDQIQAKFRAMTWPYASQDATAVAEIESRLAIAGRQRKLLTYSDLARGVIFRLPTLRNPVHVIDVFDWQDLDRAIIGDFLGYVSMRSYDQAAFFASALVVTKLDGLPSEGFYTLMKDIGLLASSRSDKAMYLWADHVAKAHTWYVENAAPAT